MSNEITKTSEQFDSFVGEIRQIIDSARKNAVRSVDFCRVQMYWSIGKRIIEKEQQGKARADYGKYIIRNLAERIMPEYGSGFSVQQLERSRQFYRLYPIASTLRTQLNWSQYKLLISIDDKDKAATRRHLIAYGFNHRDRNMDIKKGKPCKGDII